MGSESDVATDWKTHLVIGKNFRCVSNSRGSDCVARAAC